MAMMISKFNALIRSRLLWGVFLVVIVLSFVVWGMPSCREQEGPRAGVEGRLNGRDVSHAEFRAAYEMTSLELYLQTGREVFRRAEFADRLRTMTWQRIARLEKAAEWNLRTSETELQQFIAGMFADSATGMFSRERYDAYYENLVRPLGYTRAALEQFFAEELTLGKVDQLVAGQAVLSAGEVEQSFHALMDTVLADYVRISTDAIAEGVEVDAGMARAAFDADPEAFRLPEKRTVRYVVIPSPDPESVSLGDEDVESFYAENSERWEVVSTNDEGVVSSEIKPLDEVRGEIESELRAKTAGEMAEEEAAAFSSAAMPNGDVPAPDFAELAASRGLDCVEVPAFSETDDPVPSAGAAFVEEAFRREENAYDSVGDPLPVEGGWLVMKLALVEESRVPAFEEVEEAATEEARVKAVADAIAARVQVFRDDADKRGFAAAADAAGVSVLTPDPFTAFNASMSEDEDLRALSGVVAAANPGETTEAAPVADGVVIAYVKGRVPADGAEFESERPQVTQALRQRRAAEWGALFAEGLLADLEDYRAISDSGDEDAEGEEEE